LSSAVVIDIFSQAFINCLHDFVLSHFNNVDDRLKGIKEHLYHHEDFPQKNLRTPMANSLQTLHSYWN
jgi:hypothetical protein